MATRAQSRAGLSAVAARLAKAPAAPAWDKFENELLAISESGESRLEGTLLLRSLLKLAKRVGQTALFRFFLSLAQPSPDRWRRLSQVCAPEMLVTVKGMKRASLVIRALGAIIGSKDTSSSQKAVMNLSSVQWLRVLARLHTNLDAALIQRNGDGTRTEADKQAYSEIVATAWPSLYAIVETVVEDAGDRGKARTIEAMSPVLLQTVIDKNCALDIVHQRDAVEVLGSILRSISTISDRKVRHKVTLKRTTASLGLIGDVIQRCGDYLLQQGALEVAVRIALRFKTQRANIVALFSGSFGKRSGKVAQLFRKHFILAPRPLQLSHQSRAFLNEINRLQPDQPTSVWSTSTKRITVGTRLSLLGVWLDIGSRSMVATWDHAVAGKATRPAPGEQLSLYEPPNGDFLLEVPYSRVVSAQLSADKKCIVLEVDRDIKNGCSDGPRVEPGTRTFEIEGSLPQIWQGLKQRVMNEKNVFLPRNVPSTLVGPRRAGRKASHAHSFGCPREVLLSQESVSSIKPVKRNSANAFELSSGGESDSSAPAGGRIQTTTTSETPRKKTPRRILSGAQRSAARTKKSYGSVAKSKPTSKKVGSKIAKSKPRTAVKNGPAHRARGRRPLPGPRTAKSLSREPGVQKGAPANTSVQDTVQQERAPVRRSLRLVSKPQPKYNETGSGSGSDCEESCRDSDDAAACAPRDPDKADTSKAQTSKAEPIIAETTIAESIKAPNSPLKSHCTNRSTNMSERLTLTPKHVKDHDGAEQQQLVDSPCDDQSQRQESARNVSAIHKPPHPRLRKKRKEVAPCSVDKRVASAPQVTSKSRLRTILEPGPHGPQPDPSPSTRVATDGRGESAYHSFSAASDRFKPPARRIGRFTSPRGSGLRRGRLTDEPSPDEVQAAKQEVAQAFQISQSASRRKRKRVDRVFDAALARITQSQEQVERSIVSRGPRPLLRQVRTLTAELKKWVKGFDGRHAMSLRDGWKRARVSLREGLKALSAHAERMADESSQTSRIRSLVRDMGSEAQCALEKIAAALDRGERGERSKSSAKSELARVLKLVSRGV